MENINKEDLLKKAHEDYKKGTLVESITEDEVSFYSSGEFCFFEEEGTQILDKISKDFVYYHRWAEIISTPAEPAKETFRY